MATVRVAAAVAVFLIVPSVAGAQTAELSVKGSGAADGEVSSARTAAAAELRFERYRPVPDLSAAAGECCLLVYHGVKRDAVDGFEVGVEAELSRTEASDGGDTEMFLSQIAAVELRGWRVAESLSYQSPTGFSDPFWRSNAGLAAAKLEVTVPPMWSIGRPQHFLLWAMRMNVGYTELVERSGRRLSTVGYDLDVAIEGAGIQTAHTDVGLFNFRLREYGVPTSRVGNVVEGLSVAAFDFELATLDITTSSVALHAAGGIGFRSALSRFVSVGDAGGVSAKSEGTPVTTPVLWLGAALPETSERQFTLSIGGGFFARVSPDGLGVDNGVRGELRATTTIGDDIELSAALDVARLERKNVSEEAPPEIAPVGTRFLLASGRAGLSLPLARDFRLRAEGYAERTDRQDPRRHRHAPDPRQWGVGAEVSATYTFGRD